MECRWTFEKKCENFFRLNVCIDSCLFHVFGQSDGCMSDTPGQWGRTFWCRKGHTHKVLQIVFRCGHDPGVLQTWKNTIIEDANIRLVRNATFFEPNVHLYFHLNPHGVVFL